MKPIVNSYFKDDYYYVELNFPSIQQTFKGKCKLHEEDKETALRFKGYEIAENRAWIKYCSYMKKEIKLKKKALEDFISSFGASHNYDTSSYIARKLRKQIYLYKIEIESYDTDIADLKRDIFNLIHPPTFNKAKESLDLLSKALKKTGCSAEEVSKALTKLGQSQEIDQQ